MSHLTSFLVARAGRSASKRFKAATRDPVAAQHRKLMQIVERNRDTEYGREHGFEAINDLRDWRARVPVVTYEILRDRMQRVVNGESNVLTAEDPVMFARTSGTTGDAKYIPVTPTCRGLDHSDQGRTWAYCLHRDHPSAFNGKIVTLVSPAVEGYTPAGIPYGSTSGHIYKTMPRIIRGMYAAPYEVFELEDSASKYYALRQQGIASNVTLVCTANPSSVLKICQVAEANADALIEDIGRGSLRADLDIPQSIREIVEARLRPDPGRARALERARSRRGGRLLPADYWPDLAVIGCWKGGTVGAYLGRFPEWFDPDGTHPMPVRDWGYLSSEARGSIPVSDDGCGGVLTVASNVFEFVEVEDVQATPNDWQTWRFLGVDEVQVGREYHIFFTTTGGLYRYDINDIVEVVGYHNAAPVIAFRRKGRGMTSITGEKLSVNQVIEAVQTASREHGVTVDHFKAEADVDAARYVFRIEVRVTPPIDVCRSFVRSVDASLGRINLEYAAKRKSLRLEPPVLEVMRPGWYEARKQCLLADGKRDFQAKTMLLSIREENEQASGTKAGLNEEDFVVTTVTMEG